MTLSLALDERIRIVSRSMARYDERLDRERVADLSGRHFPAVETAVGKTVSWGRNPEEYLDSAFEDSSSLAECRADAPAVVVLPRNDRGDLAPYVLAQCLLAGRSYAVRPSSREAGEYVARAYHRCLREAVREVVQDERAESVVSALDLLNPEEFGAADLAEIEPERVQLVLFGDDSTLESLESEFDAAGVELATSVRMGAGRSSSVLVDVESPNLDAYCRDIARSATFDKGDDCTSASVLYVVGDFEFYDAVLESLLNSQRNVIVSEDFAAPADEQLTATRERLRAVHPDKSVPGDRLEIVECTATAPVREFPVPLIQVKYVPDRESLAERMNADFTRRDSLKTAIYTDEESTFDALAPEIPANLVERNRPTHDVDLLEPHQGLYLVADLL